MGEGSDAVRWYAVKVYYNRMNILREQLVIDKVNYFVPSMISSLLFIQTTTDYLKQFEKDYHERIWVYRDLVTHTPAAIPDHEMEVFIFVCTAGKQGLCYLGEDKAEYHTGDRVRVIDGQFKGAEGYIKRIKKDRRLVVSVRGVAAIATSYIPPQFLELINK